jgi:hypothetical protein
MIARDLRIARSLPEHASSYSYQTTVMVTTG